VPSILALLDAEMSKQQLTGAGVARGASMNTSTEALAGQRSVTQPIGSFTSGVGSMSSSHSWYVALGAALAFAAPLSAQQKPVTDVGTVPAVSAVQATTPAPATLFAPTSESAALGMRAIPVTAPMSAAVTALPAQSGPQSTNVAMMIVGGAALVVGSVIHGDTGTIIMVGGGVIGLIGLYRYLR
jgi:hypothetical protein